MSKSIILCVTSPFEMDLSRTEQTILWKQFMSGRSTHSGMASTLPYLIRRCEREGIPYRLSALPKKGYVLERMNDVGEVQ